MPGALFVVAASADQKLINRLLLHLRDWEYGEEPTWDCFVIITSKNLPETEEACYITTPPISESDLLNNVWTGKSISDVESFMLSERKADGLNTSTFLVLDEQGVKDGTIILLDALDSDDEDMKVKFKKVRVPWDKAYIMWCNLDIANMDFEDFVMDDEDCDKSGWRTYKDWDEGREADDLIHITKKRNSAIAELEKTEKKLN